ncbi:MAG: 6-phosphogluconolactonase [Minicystis sp.]
MSGASPGLAHELLIADDRAQHAALAAELVARAIVEAVDTRGIARVALSGGTTPSEAYQRLSAFALPWSQVAWFWVDERAVPPESPRSNFGAAARDLKLADGAHGRHYRMVGEGTDLVTAAVAYDALLRHAFGVASAVVFDAVILGVGDDGHTASLFPGIGAVAIADRLVAAIEEQPAKKLEARITLTAPVLLEARLVVVLARGASKKSVISAARSPGSEEEIPSRLLQRAKGRVVWVLDREAAP